MVLRFHTEVEVRNSKSQLRTFGESLTTSFPYLLRSRTLLVLIAPLFARAFLQVGRQALQVRSIREMKRRAHVWITTNSGFQRSNATHCPVFLLTTMGAKQSTLHRRLDLAPAPATAPSPSPPPSPAPNPPRVPNVQFRVLIIGRANAGKTSILQKVCDTTESPQIYRVGRWGTHRVCAHPQWRFQSHCLSRLNSTLL